MIKDAMSIKNNYVILFKKVKRYFMKGSDLMEEKGQSITICKSNLSKTEFVMGSILELTPNDKDFIEALLALYKLLPETFYRKVKALDLFFIVKYSYHDQNFRELCQQDKLIPHWQGFLPALNVPEAKGSLFNCMIGFYLLNHLYQQLLRDLPILEEELKALDTYLTEFYGNSFFLQRRSFIQINFLRVQLRNQHITLEEIPTYIEFGLEIAKQFATPGYFETAFLFLEIGCYLLNSSEEEQIAQGKFAFQMCYQHLYLAQFLEDTEVSQKAIASIYSGDLFECNKNRFTYCQFISFFNLRQAIQAHFDVPQTLIDIAKKQAEVIAKQIQCEWMKVSPKLYTTTEHHYQLKSLTS